MKRLPIPLAVLLLICVVPLPCAAAQLRVVTTLPDYASFAREIGGDRVSVTTIVRGDQDAHFIRPKPSFVNLVREADVLVDTGLDLEIWVTTVIDKSGNTRVRSGQPGYVAAAQGMTLLEKPKVMSRIEGGLHIYGNPHVTTSPLNMRVAARNIAAGLVKNDPAGKATYERNLAALERRFDEALFGPELVEMLGGKTLSSLAEKGRLISFLEGRSYKGKPLLDSLGGWMKQMLPLRGKPIVTYHKNWVYFLRLFGLEEAGTVEPKPGIPPSAKHVTELVQLMKDRRIRVILAANYFDAKQINGVAARTDAVAVIVPLYIGGEPGVDDYFELFDTWVERLLAAGKQTGLTR
ncbi:MAG: zinc ABC transporter substrate-binding protein [Armatimonadota bacterium]|nr:MAG: zinc ABC transporter substrate-binding protein [Armatimonadota bacterium]